MHWLAFFSRMNYNIKEIAKLAKLIYKKAIKNLLLLLYCYYNSFPHCCYYHHYYHYIVLHII